MQQILCKLVGRRIRLEADRLSVVTGPQAKQVRAKDKLGTSVDKKAQSTFVTIDPQAAPQSAAKAPVTGHDQPQNASGAAGDSPAPALPPAPDAVLTARISAIIASGEKPTLKTISQLSGLAVPTVSRALNDAPDIGADTKKLVRKIAEGVGYVPNRAGVRLRTGRTNVIALCISTEHDNQTGRLIGAVARALRGTPYHIIVMPYFVAEDPLKMIRYAVETGSADAVIFNQTTPQDPRVRYLRERNFPFATHGRTDWSDNHAWYDFDNTAFGEIAVKKLVRKGCRNLLIVAPPLEQNYAFNTVEGAQRTAIAASVTLTRLKTATSDDPSDQIRQAVAAHLRQYGDVDGIICSSATATMASVGGLESVGRKLGVDIEVFAKGSVSFLKLFRPQISVIEEDLHTAGEFLARAAMQAIRDPHAAPLQLLDVPIDNGQDD